MVNYYTRSEAIAQVKIMRKTGWPSARIAKQSTIGPYIITTHRVNCNCGMCPTVQTDGYAR